MTEQEVLCPKCSGPARSKSTFDRRMVGDFTSIETVCLSPECGERETIVLRGDQR